MSTSNQVSGTAAPIGSVDLEQLNAEITRIGEQIKELKGTTPVDNDAVGVLVKDLLAAKKLYADSNNGIGVDGKPFGKPLSKAEKKKAAKSDTTEDGGAAKQDSDPNSINAQKKAAKKAAKKAQKSAINEGDGQGESRPCTDAQPVPAANKGSSEKFAPAAPTPLSASASAPAKVDDSPGLASTPKQAALPTGSSAIVLQPLQVAINPNVPLIQRPVVALAAACLIDTAVDMDLVTDHRARHTAMGMIPAGVVTGDVAMARYVARFAQQQASNPNSNMVAAAKAKAIFPVATPSVAALVDMWMDYAQAMLVQPISSEQRVQAVMLSVEHALSAGPLGGSTHLVAHSLTLADVAVFAALGFPTQATDFAQVMDWIPSKAVATRRWIHMLASHPALQEATQLCMGVNADAPACVFDPDLVLEPLVQGMNALEGAVAGRVTTRFPPEPSGYLHIGHAKAVLLNDYYATRYKGRLIVRFDDTNPSKEKEEYQESIVADLAKLGVRPTIVSFTSDFFEAIRGYAKLLISKGLAYMDDTPQEQMKAERAERKDSKHRNQSMVDAALLFDLMCSGSEEGSVWCLRAKMDMKSDNGTMRDPVLFRQNLTPHHRTGTKYKAYPTYDMACPIVDSLEGVTHALRTTEYNDRDEQYAWIQKALDLRRNRIHAFSRVNFKNTVLSKRKLTWFVENGYVTGWDDARFPTVRGVVRRGVNITALRQFIYSQGASRRVVLMDWMVFYSENKKIIDKTAKRYMAIDKEQHVTLIVTNGPSPDSYSYLQTQLHPKDPSLGKRALRLCKEVILEKVDVEGMVVGEDIVLVRWGVIRITKAENGSFEGEFKPDGDVKAAKRKLSWLANVSSNIPVVLTEFDNLISKDKVEEDEDFQEFINPNTMATTEVIGDAALKTLQENEVIQLERRGFYRVDRPYGSDDKPLILYMIPDGKSKAMSGQTGKLAHR